MTLSLVPPAHVGETAASFCSRTAMLNGFPDASSFASALDFNFERFARGHDEDVRTFAEAIGGTPDPLVDGVTRRSSDGTVMVSGHSFSKKRIAIHQDRVCPDCVADDISSRPGRADTRAWARAVWIPLFARACSIHRRELVTIDAGKRYRLPDFARRLEATPLDDLARSSRKITPTPLEQYIVDRLSGAPAPDSWLGSLPIELAGDLSEFVGVELYRSRQQFFGPKLSDARRAELANEGFERLATGRQALDEAVFHLISTNYVPLGVLTPQNLFGRSVDLIKRNRRIPEYAAVLEKLEETARENLPIGSTDRLFGESRRRRFHSASTLVKEMAAPWGLVCQAIGDLSPEVTATRNQRKVYDARIAEEAVRAKAEVSACTDLAQRRARIRRWQPTANAKLDGLLCMSAVVQSVGGANVASLIFEGYLTAAWTRSGTFWVLRESLEEFCSTYVISGHLSETMKDAAEAGWVKPAIYEHEVGRDFFKRSDFR